MVCCLLFAAVVVVAQLTPHPEDTSRGNDVDSPSPCPKPPVPSPHLPDGCATSTTHSTAILAGPERGSRDGGDVVSHGMSSSALPLHATIASPVPPSPVAAFDAPGLSSLVTPGGQRQAAASATTAAVNAVPDATTMPVHVAYPAENHPDDAACSVCGDPESLSVNPILLCECCNTAVHQHCYGVQTIPAGPWFCEACRAGVDPSTTPCVLCPNMGAQWAMKPVARGHEVRKPRVASLLPHSKRGGLLPSTATPLSTTRPVASTSTPRSRSRSRARAVGGKRKRGGGGSGGSGGESGSGGDASVAMHARAARRNGTQWVHTLCALWVPETTFADAEGSMTPVQRLHKVDPRRVALRCCICKTRGWSAVQCASGSCPRPFHVTCAALSNTKMVMELDAATDTVTRRMLCSLHDGRPRARRQTHLSGVGVSGGGAMGGDEEGVRDRDGAACRGNGSDDDFLPPGGSSTRRRAATRTNRRGTGFGSRASGGGGADGMRHLYGKKRGRGGSKRSPVKNTTSTVVEGGGEVAGPCCITASCSRQVWKALDQVWFSTVQPSRVKAVARKLLPWSCIPPSAVSSAVPPTQTPTQTTAIATPLLGHRGSGISSTLAASLPAPPSVTPMPPSTVADDLASQSTGEWAHALLGRGDPAFTPMNAGHDYLDVWRADDKWRQGRNYEQVVMAYVCFCALCGSHGSCRGLRRD